MKGLSLKSRAFSHVMFAIRYYKDCLSKTINIFRAINKHNKICKVNAQDKYLKKISGTTLVVQWLEFHRPMQGVQVQSLASKLRSHKPMAKPIQYCKVK